MYKFDKPRWDKAQTFLDKARRARFAGDEVAVHEYLRRANGGTPPSIHQLRWFRLIFCKTPTPK